MPLFLTHRSGLVLRRPATQWVFADAAADRHDAAHLVTHRLQLPLAALARQLQGSHHSEPTPRSSTSATNGAEKAPPELGAEAEPSQVCEREAICIGNFDASSVPNSSDALLRCPPSANAPPLSALYCYVARCSSV